MILPRPLLDRLYPRLLDRVRLDPSWAATVRRASERGAVLHVVRSVSLLDLLALERWSRSANLPEVAFANEHSQALARPAGGRREGGSPEALLRVVRDRLSGVLFLRRPPGVLERASTTHRGKSEGDPLLSALLAAAPSLPHDVLFVPEVLVWAMRPDQVGFSLTDFAFSPAEFPGEVRRLLQLAANHEHCLVRAGEPLSLREFLASEIGGAPFAVRRLTYALVRKMEREKKSIVGPAQKPPDRIREEVLRTPRLSAVIRDLANGDAAKQAELENKARGMLDEMMSVPDPSTQGVLEPLAERLAKQVFSAIDVDEPGIARLREAARRGPIVLLPSHKSHVDYVLLSHVMRKYALPLPLVAAGDNLSFFPAGPILRRSGAFFIRRQFRGDRLYTVCVEAYVRRLLRDGHVIEFFLEGGRSRTGKPLAPMVGLLNMVVEAALGVPDRTVSFVPVSIGYERMVEETEFLRELSGEAKRAESLSSLVRGAEALRGRYGRVNVQFGEIALLSEVRKTLGIGPDPNPAKRRAIVHNIADHVMEEIRTCTAVTAGSLVATALLCHPRRGMSHAALVEQCRRLLKQAQRAGARTTPSLTIGTQAGAPLREGAVSEALRVYVAGGLIRPHVPGDTLTNVRKREDDRRRPWAEAGDQVIYVVPEERRIALDIAKNITVAFFLPRAIVSVALTVGAASSGVERVSLPHLGLRSPSAPTPQTPLADRVTDLARLLRFELLLRHETWAKQYLGPTLEAMVQDGELVAAEDATRDPLPGPGHDGLDGRGWLLFHAAVLRNFLEGYRVASRALRVLEQGASDTKTFVARALRIGEQMFLGGEIERAEAVSRPIIETALLAFRDMGLVARDGENVAWATGKSAADVAALESRIALYLQRRTGDMGF